MPPKGFIIGVAVGIALHYAYMQTRNGGPGK